MRYLSAVLVALLMLPLGVEACGPTPQKVVKEIVIRAEPTKVWGVVKDFGGMAQWHPDVESLRVTQGPDAEGHVTPYREWALKEGGKVIERLRVTPDEEMRLDYWMVEGALPVSNYHGVMQVKAGEKKGESTVTWAGRFSNKANTMDAPAGQDNAAAISAVSRFYEVGLTGLKSMLEK